MSEQEESTQVRAAEALDSAATEFSETTRELPRLSDISALLLSLGSVQPTLDAVYTRHAQRQGQVVREVHHAGEDDRGDPDNPARVRAEIALREVAQYGADTAAAATRTHGANEVMLWFDEIRVAGEH